MADMFCNTVVCQVGRGKRRIEELWQMSLTQNVSGVKSLELYQAHPCFTRASHLPWTALLLQFHTITQAMAEALVVDEVGSSNTAKLIPVTLHWRWRRTHASTLASSS